MTSLPLSILDRSHLSAGSDQSAALQRTIERAQHAEELGFKRFWVSEHHGVPGVAGAAPAVFIAALAARTQRIRLGSGGVMIPNHQPLVIAEQFGTLALLHPGRIDLGIGRSLGFTRPVRRALRRDAYDLDDLRNDLFELRAYLEGTAEITAYPGRDARRAADLDLFLLASSSSAGIAAQAGLPLVLGGQTLHDEKSIAVVEGYRDAFRPSQFAPEPSIILNVTALVADTEADARDLAISEAWAHVSSKIQGEFPPLEDPARIRTLELTPRQQSRLETIAAGTLTGTVDRVATTIAQLAKQTDAREVLLSGSFFDRDAALHSDALLARAFGRAPEL